ncbi:MAG: YtpR family tRNA-binding protein, partial [Alphaproteobacteria bacterium]
MKFTLSWLREHLDTTATTGELSRTMTMIGLEVEHVDEPSAALRPFAVAQVLEVAPHPNADRLRVCTVDTGAETIQVVCGAPNARSGMKVVLARPGMVIPDSGKKLEKGVIRGIESQGMMCSARELGLGQDHDGILDLPADSVLGTSVLDVLPIETVFDVAITPNRADCLGVRGIARDLAAAGLGTL